MNFSYHLTPRLFIDAPLRNGSRVNASTEQSHYLKHVLRLQAGEIVRIFNGLEGEWRAQIAEEAPGKKARRELMITVHEQLKPQSSGPDLRLCCAPIKKAHFDFMIEKATELGVGSIQPILTHRTQIREVNVERCRAIAIEAAEQSERLSIPEILPPLTLEALIKNWPPERALIVCAEQGVATPVKDAFALRRLKEAKQTGIVTGPEGGFTETEFDLMRDVKAPVFIRLGPRILRADTAAIAALSCWQAACGDWG